MTLTQKSKGIYVDDSFDPTKFDSIIFDCDGVLVDITNSYDQTIVKTTKYVLETLAKINDSIQIDFKIIDGFKSTGGFNDEVDLTYAAILSIVAAKKLKKDQTEFINLVIDNSDSTGIKSVEIFINDQTDISEIIEQLLIIIQNIDKKITNIVFMGMGEPFLNYKNVIKACKILCNPNGFNIGTKRITISTSGILPKIDLYIKEKHKYKLAISLNASNDSIRNKIIPINKKWNINKLIESIKKYSFFESRPIMIEYVLLKDLNDSVEDAARLARLIRGIDCKINVIPYNETDGQYQRPSSNVIEAFLKTLNEHRKGFRVFVRWSKGEDINAACGQLAVNNQ